MPLSHVCAQAHPLGNRIDITWEQENGEYDNVFVVRHTDRFPEDIDDGVLVPLDNKNPFTAVDNNLKAEETYYYTLFPQLGSEVEYNVENRVASIATANNGMSDYMMSLLPAIYHRYDNKLGQLTAFMRLVGSQLDSLQSHIRFTHAMSDLNKIPGTLLPLLAQWVGWRLDFNRPLTAQRVEVGNAPAVYKRIGLIPTLEAMVKRVSGLESRTKEYVHNIFLSNSPAQYNLWQINGDGSSGWEQGTEGLQEHLVSLDYNYHGGSSFCQDLTQISWLFYHTLRNNRWEIWVKNSTSYVLSLTFVTELEQASISDTLRTALFEFGIELDQVSGSINQVSSNVWRVGNDEDVAVTIERHLAALRVYDHRQDQRFQFDGSTALVTDNANQKYPSAVARLDTVGGEEVPGLWLFWSVFDEMKSRWRIQYRQRHDALWGEINEFDIFPPPASDDSGELIYQRRNPCAVVDGQRLWLFWFEKTDADWYLSFSVCEFDALSNEDVWQQPLRRQYRSDFDNDGVFEDDEAVDKFPQDLTAMVYNGQIFLAWTGEVQIPDPEPEPVPVIDGNGEEAPPLPVRTVTRRTIKIMTKSDTVFSNANWSLRIFPNSYNTDVVEPAFTVEANQLVMYYSSNAGTGGWSIWRCLAETFTDNQVVTEEADNQRNPLPLFDGVNMPYGLIYRSNRNVVYESESYRATETVDARYGGSFFLDTRNTASAARINTIQDSLRYSYDTGQDSIRDNEDRISRDTAGVFLDNDFVSISEFEAQRRSLNNIIPEFAAINNRIIYHASNVLDNGENT